MTVRGGLLQSVAARADPSRFADPLVNSNTAITGVLAQAEAMLHIDNLGLPAPLKRDCMWAPFAALALSADPAP